MRGHTIEIEQQEKRVMFWKRQISNIMVGRHEPKHVTAFMKDREDELEASIQGRSEK